MSWIIKVLTKISAVCKSVPRSTVYGHLDRDKTVPRQPKKTAVAKP